jgi:hypothetical protein
MRSILSFAAAFLLGAAVLPVLPAVAQPGLGGAPTGEARERWREMTFEQWAQARQRLEAMSLEQRADADRRMEERRADVWQRWESASPAECREMRERARARWETMTPEERSRAYDALKRRMEQRRSEATPEPPKRREEREARMAERWRGLSEERRAEIVAQMRACIALLPENRRARARAHFAERCAKTPQAGPACTLAGS